jgi:hypothetical protein
MKVYQRTCVDGYTFAVLLDEKYKNAFVAVWEHDSNFWDTDFSYEFIDVNPFDVAGKLDFDSVKKLGYTFIH